MAAFRFVLDFDIDKYCEKLRQVIELPKTPHHNIEYRDTGIIGTDDPLAVLSRLASRGTDNNSHNTLDPSQFYLFRQAWDERSFSQMIDELIKHDSELDFNQAWETEPASKPWTEVVDFCKTVEAGDIWKKWCRCFSGSDEPDRGMLLLLMVVLTPDSFITPGQKLEVHGGDLVDYQVVWISIFVEREMPELNKLAQFLNVWALKLYQQGHMGWVDQKGFNESLDLFLKTL